MRFAKTSAVAVTLLSLAFAGQAKAFTPPTDITPYLPAANPASVTYLKDSGVYSIYRINQTGTALVVPKGTPLAKVVKLASRNIAYTKLLVWAGLQNSTDLPERQAATNWFLAVIAPYYV